jgi:hypothetical protein
MADRIKYLVVEVKPSFFGTLSAQKLQAELDKHGAAGWELVHMHAAQPMRPVQLVFKRSV